MANARSPEAVRQFALIARWLCSAYIALAVVIPVAILTTARLGFGTAGIRQNGFMLIVFAAIFGAVFVTAVLSYAAVVRFSRDPLVYAIASIVCTAAAGALPWSAGSVSSILASSFVPYLVTLPPAIVAWVVFWPRVGLWTRWASRPAQSRARAQA